MKSKASNKFSVDFIRPFQIVVAKKCDLETTVFKKISVNM